MALGASLVRFQEKVVLMVPRARPLIPAHAMQALADGAARWRTRVVASAPLVEAAGWVMLGSLPAAIAAQETRRSPEHAAPRGHSAVRQRVS
jgi:hypothetical protein